MGCTFLLRGEAAHVGALIFSERSWVSGFGFWVLGFGLRLSSSDLRVLGFGFRVSGFRFLVSGFGVRFFWLEQAYPVLAANHSQNFLPYSISSCFKFPVSDFEFRVSGLRFRGQGLGVRLEGGGIEV